jgi:hypothetical protein
VRKPYKALQQRGSVAIWIEQSLLQEWKQINKYKKVVAEKLYPDAIIECCLLLGKVYHQPLRQTKGFGNSLLGLMGLRGFQVPDYTTLCRRQGCLSVEVSKALQSGKNIDVAVDSTDLKVYGEGEWKVRKHGASKRRIWRKLHIGIDVTHRRLFV